MKWILIVIAFGVDAGAHIDHIPFESKELCKEAQSELNYRVGVAMVKSHCVRVKP